mmetsp:Transcript_48891/g.116224  ORF Transcript_48891/g.116224 Transcript_48891/m.116224 type:complete len:727 (+) Transcript_48891:117-2297(+)
MSQQGTMQVAVPAGAPPGTMIQCTAPNGLTLQVPVPEGMAPGQTFTVAYPLNAAPAQQAANEAQEDVDLELYTPFPDKRYDVTDLQESICLIIWFPCAGWQTKTLLLGDQEVFLKKKNLCLSSTQRRPYAQLGSVDRHEACGCCYAIVSDLTPLNEKGEGGMRIGCGCEREIVDEIVQEMQARKVKRGNIAQIKKLDYMVKKMSHMRTKTMPMLMEKLGLQYSTKPAGDVAPEVLPTKTFDVTNTIESIFSCCAQKKLELTADEAILTMNGPLVNINQKREYAQLGNVQRMKNCICCYSVATDFGALAPGWGCSGGLVGEIVQELRARMQARGEIGQMKRQERIIDEMLDVVDSMPNAVRKLGGEYPPSQATMSALYGNGKVPALGTAPPLSQVLQKAPFERKTYDVTDNCESCMGCLCTCGIQGFTKQSLELEEDQLVHSITNRLDDSKMHQPYGELESVDAAKVCCCCHSVNGLTPGWGCEADKVAAIAQDLQTRKVARGNIQQLKQLESLQAACVDLGVQADIMLKQKNAQFPPTQEVMARIWGANPPGILSRDSEPPHLEPGKKFDTKDYDVTNYIDSCCNMCVTCCLAGPTTVKMQLGPDEVTWTRSNFCYQGTTRQPYAQLGAVETETACCCCYSLPDVATPGCGCSKELVDKLAVELQERKVKRGNIAQIMMQENVIQENLKTSAKIDVLLQELGVQVPTQQTMGGTTVVAPTMVGRSA